MTYSIVARDPRTGALGVAVQSHYFAAGAVVPWAEAGVGVVATQSVVDVGYGPRGLDLLRDGVSAPEALERLVAGDPMAPLRQVAMVDAAGDVAAHTGAGCVAEAVEARGAEVSVQANMMLRPTVADAMRAAYESTAADLPQRLLAALDAAEAEGGDARGRQSAGLLVVSGERSDEPWNQVITDVRVDDHPHPLDELRRLYETGRAAAAMAGTFPLLFAPGFDSETRQAFEEAMTTLDEAQAVLADNREPTFWKAVLLAKDGQADAARACLAVCCDSRAEWAQFVARLAPAGILGERALESLRAG
ncbi:MAG: DUF1028 domain-containing protein [Acidimicrobiia bacterium]